MRVRRTDVLEQVPRDVGRRGGVEKRRILYRQRLARRERPLSLHHWRPLGQAQTHHRSGVSEGRSVVPAAFWTYRTSFSNAPAQPPAWLFSEGSLQRAPFVQ